MSIVEQLQQVAIKHHIKVPVLMLMDLVNLVFEQRAEAINKVIDNMGGSHE